MIAKINTTKIPTHSVSLAEIPTDLPEFIDCIITPIFILKMK
ncbi:hypothetical protein K688_0916 [Campylobacter jejuni HB-CJGB-LXC]|nr:hypothetical protein [Campylobacter jejuni]ENI11659.1 hypothetical protein H840_1195 [Campylobacter jejuni subsp. jejuni ICDCCJ07002]ENI13183.1 hypothetical protein H741_0928 [Campylobacter jejuni subsp. jejuni ICDCCJ07004]EPS02880.1 hypothetical protein J432_1195 [Campylobacter jejuni subsp. jejuni HN-CJD07035]EPW33803.1 hypothetical protein J431_0983 [Campylobacter jejuni BJ-CJD101]KUY32444.1 hypothetical protein K688_0916 [Campylobacter jejuni HB-CJGB-LXC]KUY33614.1 hypothetical protein